MLRSVPAIATSLATAVAGLTLVGGVAHAGVPPEVTSVHVSDPKGDVGNVDGSGVNRQERQIDVIGTATLRTVQERGRDYLVMTLKAKDLRNSGKHYLHMSTTNDAGYRTFVVASVRAHKVKYSPNGGQNYTTCRRSSVSTSFKRDKTRVEVSSACLGGGSDVMTEEFGTYYSPRLNTNYATAADFLSSRQVLTYPH